jgi:hypothetical protein
MLAATERKELKGKTGLMRFAAFKWSGGLSIAV